MRVKEATPLGLLDGSLSDSTSVGQAKCLGCHEKITKSAMRNPTVSLSPRHRDAILDTALVVFIVIAYILAEASGVRKLWIFLGEAVALAGYGWLVWNRGRETWRDFGLRTDNLSACAPPIGGATLLGALAIVAWTLLSGRPLWRSDMAILVPLYPVYGVVQQLVFQGVLHRRLMLLLESRTVPATITTIAFAAVHLGSWPLVTLTVVAGTIWCVLYQRWPNVWLLGLSHGFLAALAYPMIVGDQPLQRF